VRKAGVHGIRPKDVCIENKSRVVRGKRGWERPQAWGDRDKCNNQENVRGKI